MLHSIYFSPSGTTKITADLLAGEIDKCSICHDITVEQPQSREFEADDVISIAVPVYAGRVPQIAAERLKAFHGNGQKAIAVVVYGNRDYDDALLELCDIARSQGFEIVGAAAFIAQHCIFPKVAANRPDETDSIKIAEFAECVKKAIVNGSTVDMDTVKGNRPYKKPGAVPLHPQVDKNACNGCGTCATQCPTQAIDQDTPNITDSTKCISCCRCINVCPSDARHFGGLLYKAAGWKFVKDNSRRLEPEWFV